MIDKYFVNVVRRLLSFVEIKCNLVFCGVDFMVCKWLCSIYFFLRNTSSQWVYKYYSEMILKTSIQITHSGSHLLDCCCYCFYAVSHHSIRRYIVYNLHYFFFKDELFLFLYNITFLYFTWITKKCQKQNVIFLHFLKIQVKLFI